MPKNSIIQKWLDTFSSKQKGYKQKKEEHLQQFLDYIQKTPQQIINENKSLTKKEFKKTYSTNFNSFIAYLKNKNLKPILIREITSSVQDFFKYANLPLSLGVRGHFNLFLK
jgi:hypothetical protein